MGMVDGGELLLRVLEQAGVDTIFTLHGGHLDAIFMAAAKRNIRLIDTRHEQAAGHAADGWARTTGRPGVCAVTAGPGFTDAISAITNAYLDCVPALFIAGAAPLRDAETLPLQGGYDQIAVASPITKWAHRVTHTERIPDLVAHALRICRSGRPGPVLLELPIDVLFARIEEDSALFPSKIAPDTAPAPTRSAVAEMAAWLAAAQRPAIFAGGGAWFAGAGAELLAFAERSGIPVFSNSKAHGLVPGDHPLCGGSLGVLRAVAAAGRGEADVVLVLGARLGMFTGGRTHPVIPASARLIQVDIAPEELGRNRDAELAIVADCREALAELNAVASEIAWPDRSAWAQTVRQVRRGHRSVFGEALEKDEPPMHPYRLVTEIAKVLPRDAIVTADGGETSAWMDMVAEVGAGGHWLSHGYLGCLGTGMPFALAAKAAHPERPVLCIVGDGSVGLNFSEFDTMVRHDLAIVTVVNNDQLWGMSAHGQDLIYGEGKRVVTELAPTRYDLAAQGFGCHAEFVDRPAEIGPALERAFASGKPACVNAMTDGSVISPATVQLYGVNPEPDSSRRSAPGGAPRVKLPYYEDLDG